MMFAPMRSVMAMQQTHCGVNDNLAAGSAVISEHSGHDMTAMSMTIDSGIQKFEKSHDCCSASKGCVSGCDMNISVSLLTQESTYTPNFTNVSESVSLILNLIKKEFTPPLRPPLIIPG